MMDQKQRLDQKQRIVQNEAPRFSHQANGSITLIPLYKDGPQLASDGKQLDFPIHLGTSVENKMEIGRFRIPAHLSDLFANYYNKAVRRGECLCIMRLSPDEFHIWHCGVEHESPFHQHNPEVEGTRCTWLANLLEAESEQAVGKIKLGSHAQSGGVVQSVLENVRTPDRLLIYCKQPSPPKLEKIHPNFFLIFVIFLLLWVYYFTHNISTSDLSGVPNNTTVTDLS